MTASRILCVKSRAANAVRSRPSLLIDFNGSRVEVHVDVQDGELVDEAAYQAYLGQRA